MSAFLSTLRIRAAASPSFNTTRVPPDNKVSMALIGRDWLSQAARTSPCDMSTFMARVEGAESRIALPD